MGFQFFDFRITQLIDSTITRFNDYRLRIAKIVLSLQSKTNTSVYVFKVQYLIKK